MYKPVQIYLITDAIKDYGALANFLIISFVIFKSAKAQRVNETILDAMVTRYLGESHEQQDQNETLNTKESYEHQPDETGIVSGHSSSTKMLIVKGSTNKNTDTSQNSNINRERLASEHIEVKND